MSANFLVTVCQVGAERALKDELLRERPELRAAFQRPGLVTWKDTRELAPDVELRSVFARAYAVALGPARDVAEVLAMAGAIGVARLRLHVWERDAWRPGEEPEGVVPGARAAAVQAELIAHAGSRFLDGEVAQSGDHVLDVIVAEGEPHFVAHHVHTAAHSPFAGGRIPIVVPADAPSRAYRKIEEAIAWSGARLGEGQVALEIGSAPGGASLSLLRRGLTVIGVDPGAMSQVVLAWPSFRHLQTAVGELDPAALPPRVDWLLLDVNLAPQVALHQIRGLVSALRPRLAGALFTLKLNDWSTAARVPELLRRMREMGFDDVRATQLPSNRQEIFAWGRGSPKAAPKQARAPQKSGRRRGPAD